MVTRYGHLDKFRALSISMGWVAVRVSRMSNVGLRTPGGGASRIMGVCVLEGVVMERRRSGNAPKIRQKAQFCRSEWLTSGVCKCCPSHAPTYI